MCSIEIWKSIDGYEGIYEVSNLGRIRKVVDGSIVHQSNCQGYKMVGLYKNKKAHSFGVHRLVAYAFCDGYEDGKMVNHKNECKFDNRAENLEWCNNSYNVTYNDAQLKGQMSAATRPQLNDKRKEIGRTLRQLRKEKGLKVYEAAALALISGGTLNKIESGTNSASFDTLESIANVYGYTLTLKAR